MKLENIKKKKKESKNGKCFYISVDMSEIKRDESIKKSQIKRGERENKKDNYIIICGCGTEGCFIHGDLDSTILEKKYPFLTKLSKMMKSDKLKDCVQNFKINHKKLVKIEKFLETKWPYFEKWKGVPSLDSEPVYKDMVDYYSGAKHLQEFISL